MPNNEIKDKPMMWYYHPNFIVRMLYTQTHTCIDKDIDLTPSYDNNLKIGVVIGTYGSIPYIDLGLHFLKNVNGINDILIHDDGSPDENKLKELCKSYDVDFYSTGKNMWHKACVGSLGDENCFYEGLKWAKNKNIDILIKFSRRLIPCYKWVDDFKKLVIDSDGTTFSSYCVKDNFPIRTECFGMNVKAWSSEYILNTMKQYIDNEIPVFAEYWYDRLAKQLDYQNFSSKHEKYNKDHRTKYVYTGYTHWYDLLGTNRYNTDNRHENILWHMYSSCEDYLNKSKEIFGDRYSINDFKRIVNI